MHIQTSPLLQLIYAKTSKGHDEIVRPKFGLNPRQRRILMFVDGEHTLVALHGYFPLQEMEEIVTTLAGHHFIFLTERQAQETASPCRRGNAGAAYTWSTGSELDFARRHDDVYPILTQDPEKVLKAKELMLEIAATHLGILGREIVQKIEAATCATSLSSLAGQWTMALCASKTASRYAALYLEQLKCILYEEAPDAAPMPILALSSPRHTPYL